MVYIYRHCPLILSSAKLVYVCFFIYLWRFFSFRKEIAQSETKYFLQMLFDSSETSFKFLKLLSCLSPIRMIKLKFTVFLFWVILDTYCSFELFLIFQNVIIYMHIYIGNNKKMASVNISRNTHRTEKKKNQRFFINLSSDTKIDDLLTLQME